EESEFNDEYNFMVKNFKRFLKSDTGFGRKGNEFIRGNRYGGRGRGDMNKLRSNSRREMGCFGFGDKNHRCAM
ncbi:hypothetical protein Tco_1390230, partial [Tanacetum coccineum]